MLTIDYINQHFIYEDGKLLKRKTGKHIGWISKEGYRKCTINGNTYYTHRVIFFMFNGYWPGLVDHIDRNKLNNRIENLRDTTFHKNVLNQKVNRTSKSGIKNISWHKASNRWRVQICRNYTVIDIGYFKCIGEAIKARTSLRKCNEYQ